MTLPHLPLPEPGTRADEAGYALREAASPEVQEFLGGDTVVVSVSLVTILIVLIIILIVSD